MTLSPGTRVGPYAVVEPLGAGGMGEVYRARDEKLGRDVAVKVLTERRSHDGNRVARFEREAKLLASLNHANVATLYGVEELSGRWCLVMELVEGETLAERIARGPLPVDRAVAIFRQIGAGLEAAHGKGILHRDLKPANVKIAPDGTVRLLDFGLAKTLADPDAITDSRSPTLTQGTAAGVLLGTPSYMSPEQTRGDELDARTDIWAFGCCLFETLSGRRPFHGATVTDVITSVARDEPPWAELPEVLSDPLMRLLRRCLEKDPSRRIRHIGDAILELDEARDEPSGEDERRKLAGWIAIGAALVIGSVLTGVVLSTTGSGRSSRGVARLQLVLEDAPLALSERPSLAISPDGSHIAYVGVEYPSPKLFVRSIDATDVTEIPGSEGATGPFFSPDGASVGFFQGAELRRASLLGGGSRRVIDVPPVTRGAYWAREGIYLTPTNAHGLGYYSTSVDRLEGDAVQVPDRFAMLSAPDPRRNERSHGWPQVLPDGSAALVSVLGLDSESYDSARIAILDFETRAMTTLVAGGYHARFVPSGHLLYMSAGNIMAAPFSLSRRAVTGPAKVVVRDVVSDARTGGAYYAVSEEGTLVYARGAPLHFAENRLMWVTRDGTTEPATDESRVFRWPRLSPDGSRVAVSIEGPSDDVWILELVRGTLTRLTFEARNLAAVWTPDGGHLIFSTTRSGLPSLWSIPADGSGEARAYVASSDASFPGAWTRDGRLSFTVGAQSSDVWLAAPTGGAAESLLDTRFREASPSFSPDGRWLAFASDESGSIEVYVQPFPGPGGKTRISTGGGSEPVWAPSGAELFYRSGSKMMGVSMTFEPSLRIAQPVTLFEGPFEPSILPGLTNYDVSPDGRFVMLEPIERREGPRELEVVLNWFEELERLVPRE